MTFTRNDERPRREAGPFALHVRSLGAADRYELSTPAYVAGPLCMVPYRPARASVPE